MNQETTTISTKVIIRFILIILALILAYFIRDILLMVFTALILAAALDRPIDRLQEKKVPRALSAILIYLLLFSILGLLLYLILPPLAKEIKSFTFDYSQYLENLTQKEWKDFLAEIADRLALSSETIFSTIVNIFGGLISFLTIFAVAIFFNIQERGVKKFIYYLSPTKYREYTLSLFDKIQKRLSSWLWARIFLSLGVALLVFLGLYLLGLKYALALGVLAGLLDIIPFIGPILASIPAIILAFFVSPLLALLVTGFYLFINIILESFILVPLLMKKAVDLNPALIILVVLIGAKLAGLLGIILAIPTTVIISVLLDEYIQTRREVI